MTSTPPPPVQGPGSTPVKSMLKTDTATSPTNTTHVTLVEAPPSLTSHPSYTSTSTSPTSAQPPPSILTPRTSVSGPAGPPSNPPSVAGGILTTPRTSISAGPGFPRTHTGSSLEGGKYRRKVGFETFDDLPDTLFTFTAQAKSEGYKRSRNTRVFLVAVSPDESGTDALDWLMSELVEDGDEVVAMRVKDMTDEERHSEATHAELRDEAKQLLSEVLAKNNEEDGRKISATVEIVVGRVPDMILKMIALYRPDCELPWGFRKLTTALVVGTKGQRSKLASWKQKLQPGMGSISRFAVTHSPVPVIVVRPERKVKKTQSRREAAGKRGQYAALVGPEDNVLSRSRSRERSRDGRRSVDLGRAISRDY